MRISIISIAIAIIVNLITISVVKGFKNEVRRKIVGFGGHIHLTNSGEGTLYESTPIRIDQDILSELALDKNIKSISPIGFKPVLFQSFKNKITYQDKNGESKSETIRQVHGAMLKGVNADYDLSFFQENLIEGSLPQYQNENSDNHILISQKVSNNLNFKVNDTVNALFVKNKPIRKQFIIVGIYHTGLEEFDSKIVIGKLSTVQKLNDWGIQTEIDIADTLYKGRGLLVQSKITGGNGNHRYDLGKGFNSYSGFPICPQNDTTIRVIGTDYWSSLNQPVSESTLPDTSFLKIEIEQPSFCQFKLDEDQNVVKNYLNDQGTKYQIKDGDNLITITKTSGKGSSHNYVGAFEINVHNWDMLDKSVEKIQEKVLFIPNEHDEVLQVSSIKRHKEEIFVWLGFLDINVAIILTLMILIGIINMGSALLVLILIRSNFIGLMKAMGARDISIRKVFLMQSAYLIGRGMLWGNIIGLGICLAQKYLHIIKLNPAVYYLSEVPIELNIWHWAALNIGTLIICLTALIIPSIVISRISPVKSIKFN